MLLTVGALPVGESSTDERVPVEGAGADSPGYCMRQTRTDIARSAPSGDVEPSRA